MADRRAQYHTNGAAAYDVYAWNQSTAPQRRPEPQHLPEERPLPQKRQRVKARTALAPFTVVGMLAVELFETEDGRVLVNELAMRPHNTGHWSIDGAVTSQFENHLRAVCDLPLGSAAPRQPPPLVSGTTAVTKR